MAPNRQGREAKADSAIIRIAASLSGLSISDHIIPLVLSLFYSPCAWGAHRNSVPLFRRSTAEKPWERRDFRACASRLLPLLLSSLLHHSPFHSLCINMAASISPGVTKTAHRITAGGTLIGKGLDLVDCLRSGPSWPTSQFLLNVFKDFVALYSSDHPLVCTHLHDH